jgi:hypothetical protein
MVCRVSSSGADEMKRHILLIALLGLSACDKPANPSTETFTAPTPKVELYRADAQFNPIAGELLAEDLSVFLDGGDSLLAKVVDASVVSAKEVASTYQQNQVAGDQKYFKKKLFVVGTIGSINSGLGNAPYITFKDTGLIGAQGHLSKGLENEAAALKKNQRIALVCVGGGSVVGTPMFRDCQFASSVGKSTMNQLTNEIADFFKGKKVSELATVFAIQIEGLSRTVEDSVDCSKGCEKKMDITKARSPAFVSDLISKMRAGGLQVDQTVEQRLTKSKE